MSGTIRHLGKDDFEEVVLRGDTPVLVDFWAEWCAPCRALAPVLEELAGEFAGRARIAKVDVDDQPELAQRYEIRAVPSLLLFRGGEVAERLTGVRPRAELRRMLDEG